MLMILMTSQFRGKGGGLIRVKDKMSYIPFKSQSLL